jgi:hypothetical protein
MEGLLADWYGSYGHDGPHTAPRCFASTASNVPVQDNDARWRLQQALDALPSSLREVIVLHYLQGFSYAEVAAALALPLSTVKGRLFHSRRRLRGALTPDGMASRRTPMQPATPTSQSSKGEHSMAEPTHLVVDKDALIDQLYAYVTDPSPSRTKRLESIVIPDLASLGGRPEPARLAAGSLRTSIRIVIDAMVLDGVRSRRDVAAFIDYCTLFSQPYTVHVE